MLLRYKNAKRTRGHREETRENASGETEFQIAICSSSWVCKRAAMGGTAVGGHARAAHRMATVQKWSADVTGCMSPFVPQQKGQVGRRGCSGAAPGRCPKPDSGVTVRLTSSSCCATAVDPWTGPPRCRPTTTDLLSGGPWSADGCFRRGIAPGVG
ncbi:hypothetical protein VTI74DRAFT_5817 [Chaetomium olivicolor]